MATINSINSKYFYQLENDLNSGDMGKIYTAQGFRTSAAGPDCIFDMDDFKKFIQSGEAPINRNSGNEYKIVQDLYKKYCDIASKKYGTDLKGIPYNEYKGFFKEYTKILADKQEKEFKMSQQFMAQQKIEQQRMTQLKADGQQKKAEPQKLFARFRQNIQKNSFLNFCLSVPIKPVAAATSTQRHN